MILVEEFSRLFLILGLVLGQDVHHRWMLQLSLSRELMKLRTGRASPGMLDHIILETGGMKMQLNHLAVVSVIDSKTLSINPYDPNTMKELEKAIVSSPLGLNPKADGDRLVAAIPALTKEHIQVSL